MWVYYYSTGCWKSNYGTEGTCEVRLALQSISLNIDPKMSPVSQLLIKEQVSATLTSMSAVLLVDITVGGKRWGRDTGTV